MILSGALLEVFMGLGIILHGYDARTKRVLRLGGIMIFLGLFIVILKSLIDIALENGCLW